MLHRLILQCADIPLLCVRRQLCSCKKKGYHPTLPIPIRISGMAAEKAPLCGVGIAVPRDLVRVCRPRSQHPTAASSLTSPALFRRPKRDAAPRMGGQPNPRRRPQEPRAPGAISCPPARSPVPVASRRSPMCSCVRGCAVRYVSPSALESKQGCPSSVSHPPPQRCNATHPTRSALRHRADVRIQVRCCKPWQVLSKQGLPGMRLTPFRHG